VPPAFNFARDVLDVHARDATRVALVHAGSDGTVDVRTYADLARESTRWAHLMLARAPDPGSRVVIALDPGTAWAAAIIGALRAGLIPAPVGSSHSADSLSVRLVQVEAALTIVDHRSENAIAGAAQRLGDTAPAVVTLEEAQWELLRVGDPLPYVERMVESPALLLFTRGRTSTRPRPVLHSHASTFAAYVLGRDWLDARDGELVWCNTHEAADAAVWCGVFGSWAAGAKTMFLDRDLEPAERAELLERFHPSIVVGSPDLHQAFLDLVESFDVRTPALRSAVTTGDNVSRSLARQFAALTNVELRDGYGTAETGVIAFQHVGDPPQPGSIGRPAPGHIVAPVDEAGFPASVGTIGDLAVYGRPPSLCSGYWTGWPPHEEVIGDSWTLTGDRGHVDQYGNIWLDGASDEITESPGYLLSRAPGQIPVSAELPAPSTT
jgi:acetyl-CoA synthetase